MPPWKVLYIEDDKKEIELLRQEINQSMFEIVGEVYGDKAIQQIQDDKSKTIKAVLLDIQLNDPSTTLPQKLSGEEVARRIKTERPEIPIFAVSGVGNIRGFIKGYYRKENLFKSRNAMRDFEHALEESIYEAERTMYYPRASGTKWLSRWGKEYIEFRNSPTFPNDERDIGEEAIKDFNQLENNQIKRTYRAHRGADNLTNVLIARRVICATVFNFREHWGDVSKFLNFSPEDERLGRNDIDDGLRNFMNACGIAWGSITNRATLLKEEEQWLVENKFLTF